MKYLLSVFSLFLCFSCFAQFDSEPFDFKRNTIRVAVGTQSSNSYPIKYISNGIYQKSRDFEVEYERQLNRHFSAGILYRLIDYDLRRYIYREHQRQLNFFYAPFNNFRRIQFKIGAGVTHSTIHESNYFDYEISGLSFTRSSRPDFGLQGIVELNYRLLKNISVGVKGFQQFTDNSNSPFGGLVKLGYSF